ncbi:hypothetical protein SDC9_207200 [bioreactor metagenome]|uniref:Uncharacterized protein n=1 Tax=bioreactor metagenome TaxID=1076179 RepID=A0A645J9S1_9ZZZZ
MLRLLFVGMVKVRGHDSGIVFAVHRAGEDIDESLKAA